MKTKLENVISLIKQLKQRKQIQTTSQTLKLLENPGKMVKEKSFFPFAPYYGTPFSKITL